jgi:hypothetical protein
MHSGLTLRQALGLDCMPSTTAMLTLRDPFTAPPHLHPPLHPQVRAGRWSPPTVVASMKKGAADLVASAKSGAAAAAAGAAKGAAAASSKAAKAA